MKSCSLSLWRSTWTQTYKQYFTYSMFVIFVYTKFQISVSSGVLVTVMKQKAKYLRMRMCHVVLLSTKVLTSFDSAQFKTVSDIWFQ